MTFTRIPVVKIQKIGSGPAHSQSFTKCIQSFCIILRGSDVNITEGVSPLISIDKQIRFDNIRKTSQVSQELYQNCPQNCIVVTDIVKNNQLPNKHYSDRDTIYVCIIHLTNYEEIIHS